MRYDVSTGVFLEAVIERELNILTKDDEKEFAAECREAKAKELGRWTKLKVVERRKKKGAPNRIDSKWVLKFKIVAGKRVVKARLTVRGFKDRQQPDLRTFAATGTRASQRIVCSVASGARLLSASGNPRAPRRILKHSGVCGDGGGGAAAAGIQL